MTKLILELLSMGFFLYSMMLISKYLSNKKMVFLKEPTDKPDVVMILI